MYTCNKTIGEGIIMTDFNKMAKQKYEELIKQKEAIENELKPLEKYLKAAGELAKQKRGPRKKKAQ